VGRACQAMADGKTKTETLHKPRDLKAPAHRYPDSQSCVRKTFSTSFVPQLTENHTSSDQDKFHITGLPLSF